MRLINTLIFTVSALVLASLMVSHAQPDSSACPQLSPRLTAGEWGRVTWESALNLRPQPTLQLARTDILREGTLLEVIDGPTCAEGYHWWQVRDVSGRSGWAAEGLDDEYWLEPRGTVMLIEDPDGVERLYAVDEDGEIIERADCMTPPDDYDRTTWNGEKFNERTVAMLRHAQQVYLSHPDSLYLNFEFQVVQGSYNAGVVAASFGTHDGGGAVDFSVRDPADFSVMSEQIPLLIDALRVSGFAAWLRRPDELFPGSAIHIHAIAVADRDLSPAARRQIDGPEGYIRGYNGLPVPDGQPPIADADGEPIFCQWMIEAGFGDLRPPTESPED